LQPRRAIAIEKWRALLTLTWFLCAQAVYAQSAEPPAQKKLPAETSSGPRVEVLSNAELDALGLESTGPRVDTSFHFWGFADFNSSSQIRASGASAAAQGRHQNFFIGNLNLYLSKNLSESFRTMAEVRLTYLPNGSYYVSQNGYEQVDTSTVDYANGQSLTRWGGIILQRVYLEWTLHRMITVRGGQFLSPFGIWNVDHGSFAYIPAQRPIAITSGLFPGQQSGLEVLGRWNANGEHTLGYHLTLSNGTGPISEYKDLDRNKALGGRLYWEYFGETYIRAGISGYYGRNTVAIPTATLTGSTIELETKVSSQSDNLALAADLLIKHGGVHLQTEWLTQQRRYTERGRVVHGTFGAPIGSAASADTFSWAGYVLAAYRFGGRFAFTPFMTFQAVQMDQFNQSVADDRFTILGGTGGLNVSPIESVVFKLECTVTRFPQAPPFLRVKANALVFQAAWAF
jgi:hypothetical protein